MEWIDKDGFKEQLRILNEVCAQWKDIGALLGFSGAEMKEIERNCPRDIKECCREILTSWIEHGRGHESYPATWEGLHKLLEDIECSTLAKLLKEALTILMS